MREITTPSSRGFRISRPTMSSLIRGDVAQENSRLVKEHGFGYRGDLPSLTIVSRSLTRLAVGQRLEHFRGQSIVSLVARVVMASVENMNKRVEVKVNGADFVYNDKGETELVVCFDPDVDGILEEEHAAYHAALAEIADYPAALDAEPENNLTLATAPGRVTDTACLRAVDAILASEVVLGPIASNPALRR